MAAMPYKKCITTLYKNENNVAIYIQIAYKTWWLNLRVESINIYCTVEYGYRHMDQVNH